MYTNKKGHPTFKACIKLQLVPQSPEVAIHFKTCIDPIVYLEFNVP